MENVEDEYYEQERWPLRQEQSQPPNPSQMSYAPCKVLEGLVCDALDNFTTEIGHRNDNQWGFRRGRSTEGLLIYLTETWEKAVNNGDVVGVVFIDLQEAY